MNNFKNFIQKTKDTISGQITKTLQNDPFVTQVLQFPNLQLTVTRFIAGGSFANVYAVDRQEFVVKRQICNQYADAEAVAREFFIQQKLSQFSCNIVRPFFLKIDDVILVSEEQFQQVSLHFPATALILMENCGTSLLSLLNKPGYLPEQTLLTIFTGILNAFAAMANLNLLNRDGKVENILISNFSNLHELRAEQVKICDFGSASYEKYEDPLAFINSAGLRNQVETDIQNNTTPQYRAPEMIDLFSRMPIGEKSDVFALGVAFYRLMYKKFPFPDGEILANYNCRWEFPDESPEYLRLGKYDEKPDIPLYQEKVKYFVRRALVKHVQDRADVFELAALASQLTGLPVIQKGAFSADPVRIGKSAATPATQQAFGAARLDLAWYDVGGQPAEQQAQQTQQSNSEWTPARNGYSESGSQHTLPQVELFDFQPIQPAGEPALTSETSDASSRAASQPYLPYQQLDLFDFQPVQAQQPPAPASAPGQLNLFDFAPAPGFAAAYAPVPALPTQDAPSSSSVATDSLLDFDAPVIHASVPSMPRTAVPGGFYQVAPLYKAEATVAPAVADASSPAVQPNAASPATATAPANVPAPASAQPAAQSSGSPEFTQAFAAFAASGQFPVQAPPSVLTCLDYVKKCAFTPFTAQNFTAADLTRRYQSLSFGIFAVYYTLYNANSSNSSYLSASPITSTSTTPAVSAIMQKYLHSAVSDVLAVSDAFKTQIQNQKQAKFNLQSAQQITHELLQIYRLLADLITFRLATPAPLPSFVPRASLESLESLARSCGRTYKLRSAPVKYRSVGGALAVAVYLVARACAQMCASTDAEAVKAAKSAYYVLRQDFQAFRELLKLKFDLCEVLELLVL